MVYTPKIINPDEVRAFFTPYLDHTIISDLALLMKIEAVEKYVSQTYFDGSFSASAKVPCILLVASKLIQEPKIANHQNYASVKKIGDVTFFDSSPAFKQAKSWEQMAHSILEHQRNRWKIRLTYE